MILLACLLPPCILVKWWGGLGAGVSPYFFLAASRYSWCYHEGMGDPELYLAEVGRQRGFPLYFRRSIIGAIIGGVFSGILLLFMIYFVDIFPVLLFG